MTAAPGGSVRACVFALGEAVFAVEVEAVREIAVVDELTPVPLAPAHVLGVTNLRGDVLPVIDASALLAARGRSASRKRQAVVLTTASGDAGLIVDEIAGLETLDDITAAPASSGRAAEWLVGRARREQGSVTVLDPAKLLAALRPVPGSDPRGDRP